jgi:type II restriction enzyme
VVTESWGEHNLYCPNCSSSKLNRLAHNTQASDFCCPKCSFWFQLKGQKTPIGNSIADGAYESMMRAIRTDAAPSYYFMHYDLRTWTVRNLLLVPHFAFPPSAIVKRNPLAATARRAGWVGCNFALNRIPADARIEIVSSRKNQSLTSSPAEITITPPEEVREKFRRIKPLKELSITQRGWTLDVLNIVRRISDSRRRGLPPQNQTEAGHETLTITNADVYAHERELSQLHPDNRHVKDKIRQKLQVLRDLGILHQPERGMWALQDEN